MRKVKRIEIVLENCEVIQVKKSCIGTFCIKNITKSISHKAMDYIIEYSTAEEIFLQIHQQSNKVENNISGWGSDELPFDSINNFNDITAISVIFENDEEEYIFVDWNEYSCYENKYQTSMIDGESGDLYIVISSINTIESIFNK